MEVEDTMVRKDRDDGGCYPKMGPEPGTERYRGQVDRILKLLRSSNAKTEEEIRQITLLYLFDTSYARGAIAEAVSTHEKEVRRGSQAPTG